jgi:glutamate N-acetyltransferase/amino-acid N-acetyltransferase
MSVTAPEGFTAAGGSAGIKAGGVPDVAVVVTDDGKPVPAAGVFTSNLAAAAPVQISRAHLQQTGGRAAGVIYTSGNANAATGQPGRDAATQLCGAVARGIGASPSEILVCQTGLIGIPFPMASVAPHLDGIVAARRADPESGAAAARAIMTTDTVPKVALVRGGGITVGAMAKGAAMLAPNMATMLALCTTDAAVDPDTLLTALRAAVRDSFNAITVDGCTSTNDTVLVLASGRGATPTLDGLTGALTEACASLAAQMVDDAEGATKVSHVRVIGAESDAAAHAAARKVADSMLVQCSLNGEDPYWGRIVSELGSAGVSFDIDRVSVAYGGVAVCAGGVATPHDPAAAAAVAAHLGGRHIEILCDLGLGNGAAAVLGTDLGYGYIDENRTTS